MDSTRNYIQYHVINHNGKNYKKDKNIYELSYSKSEIIFCKSTTIKNFKN